jgi:6-phosphogluconolactonase/glucosamine-6-phosphate isomerase/deaminase
MGDDRFVPYSDPLSNSGMAKRQFLDVCAPAGHIHMIDTGKDSPDGSAADYEQILHNHRARRSGSALFDVVLLGVGPDGHTASLFPGSAEARETSRWVVGVAQAAVAPFVPRVSLTLPCLSLTHEMVFMAAGAEKKAILERGVGIPSNAIATIGDMANDLPMFARSGLSIAMGNASEMVKARADRVTSSNAQDGFVAAVSMLLDPLS